MRTSKVCSTTLPTRRSVYLDLSESWNCTYRTNFHFINGIQNHFSEHAAAVSFSFSELPSSQLRSSNGASERNKERVDISEVHEVLDLKLIGHQKQKYYSLKSKAMSDELVDIFKFASFNVEGAADEENDTVAEGGDGIDYHDIMTEEYELNDTRVAMIGNVDSGKSTLIGVLTNATLDDGRGGL